MQEARELEARHRAAQALHESAAAAASSQAAAAEDARARLLVQGQSRDAESAAATVAVLKRRAEGAHRTAITSEAEADLQHDVAAAAEAIATRASDERALMLAAVAMLEGAFAAAQAAGSPAAIVGDRHVAAAAACKEAGSAAKALKAAEAQCKAHADAGVQGGDTAAFAAEQSAHREAVRTCCYCCSSPVPI